MVYDQTYLATRSSSSNGHDCLNISTHSCMSINISRHGCNVYGISDFGDAQVSLSNIFVDDEEKVDIFDENSMLDSISSLISSIVKNQKDESNGHILNSSVPNRKHSNSSKSFRTVDSHSTGWQGSCSSFEGGSMELLDLTCHTVSEVYNGDLSLNKKLTTIPSKCGKTNYGPDVTKPPRIMATSRKGNREQEGGSELVNGSTNSPERNGGRPMVLKQRQSMIVKPLCCGMQTFESDSVHSHQDAAPRKPIRRHEESLQLQPQHRNSCDESVTTFEEPNFDPISLSNDHVAPKAITIKPSLSILRGLAASGKNIVESFVPSPTGKKKVMKIAQKDLEIYLSGAKDMDRSSFKAIIPSKTYQKLIHAAAQEQFKAATKNKKHTETMFASDHNRAMNNPEIVRAKTPSTVLQQQTDTMTVSTTTKEIPHSITFDHESSFSSVENNCTTTLTLKRSLSISFKNNGPPSLSSEQNNAMNQFFDLSSCSNHTMKKDTLPRPILRAASLKFLDTLNNSGSTNMSLEVVVSNTPGAATTTPSKAITTTTTTTVATCVTPPPRHKSHNNNNNNSKGMSQRSFHSPSKIRLHSSDSIQQLSTILRNSKNTPTSSPSSSSLRSSRHERMKHGISSSLVSSVSPRSVEKADSIQFLNHDNTPSKKDQQNNSSNQTFITPSSPSNKMRKILKVRNQQHHSMLQIPMDRNMTTTNTAANNSTGCHQLQRHRDRPLISPQRCLSIDCLEID